MALSRSELFDIHSENLAEVERAIRRIRKRINREVALGQDRVADDLTKVYAFMLGTKLEVRLAKLVQDPAAFSAPRRANILGQKSQEQQWVCAIDEAFMTKYDARRLTKTTLPATALWRRDVLHAAVRQDLAPVIQLRNKLAHGQWRTTLTSSGSSRSAGLQAKLDGLDAVSLKHQERLMEKIADAIRDLAVSAATFERDFDAHFRAVEDAKLRLTQVDYPAWVQSQRKSLRR